MRSHGDRTRMIVPSMDAVVNRWFTSYEAARASLEAELSATAVTSTGALFQEMFSRLPYMQGMLGITIDGLLPHEELEAQPVDRLLFLVDVLVAQDDRVFAMEERLQLLDALAVHDSRAADADELLRVQP